MVEDKNVRLPISGPSNLNKVFSHGLSHPEELRGPSAFKTLVKNSCSLEDPIESKDHYILPLHDACRIYLVIEILLVRKKKPVKGTDFFYGQL